MPLDIANFIITDEQWSSMNDRERLKAVREGCVSLRRIRLIRKEGPDELRAAVEELLARTPSVAEMINSISGGTSMHPFDNNFWRMMQETDRIRRAEEMMGIDRNAITRMRDFWRENEAARRMIEEISRNPSHNLLLEASITSPLTEAARAANLSAIEIFKTIQLRVDIAEQIKQISPAWTEHLQLAKGLSDSVLQTALGSHMSRITEMSLLAESSLARFRWEDVGAVIRLPEEIRSPLRDEFLGFTRSYEHLLTSFRDSEAAILSLPPNSSELSAREFFLGSRLVKAVSVEAPEDELEEESEELEREIGGAVDDELEVMLGQLNPDFINMRDGARRALESDNPDRVRHFITSYRELSTHVLHLLSPDKEVRSWSTSSEDFANGKPTRKARLHFICRNVNHGPLTDFLEKDIETMVRVFDLLNKGTHQVSSAFTEPQLVALRTKAESAIHFMLTISQV